MRNPRFPAKKQLSWRHMITRPVEESLRIRTCPERTKETSIIYCTFNINHGQLILGMIMYIYADIIFIMMIVTYVEHSLSNIQDKRTPLNYQFLRNKIQ